MEVDADNELHLSLWWLGVLAGLGWYKLEIVHTELTVMHLLAQQQNELNTPKSKRKSFLTHK